MVDQLRGEWAFRMVSPPQFASLPIKSGSRSKLSCSSQRAYSKWFVYNTRSEHTRTTCTYSTTKVCHDGFPHVFYILDTQTKVILTCDSVHSWLPYSATILGDQATGTMTRYLSRSHYPNTELTISFPILVMPSVWLGSDNYRYESGLQQKQHGKEAEIPPTLNFHESADLIPKT